MAILIFSNHEFPVGKGAHVQPILGDRLVELYVHPQKLSELLRKHRIVVCDPGANFTSPLSPEESKELHEVLLRDLKASRQKLDKDVVKQGFPKGSLLEHRRRLQFFDEFQRNKNVLHLELWKRVSSRIRTHMMNYGGILILRCPDLGNKSSRHSDDSMDKLFGGLVPGIVPRPPLGATLGMHEAETKFHEEHRRVAKLIDENTMEPRYSFSFLTPWDVENQRHAFPQTLSEISPIEPHSHPEEFREAMNTIDFHGTFSFQRHVDGTTSGVAQRINDMCILIANEFDVATVVRKFKPVPKLIVFYKGDEIPDEVQRGMGIQRPIAVRLGEYEGCIGLINAAKLLALARMKKADLRLTKSADFVEGATGNTKAPRIFEGASNAEKQIQNLVDSLSKIGVEKVGDLEVGKLGKGMLFERNGLSADLKVESIDYPELANDLIPEEIAKSLKDKEINKSPGMVRGGDNQLEQANLILKDVYEKTV